MDMRMNAVPKRLFLIFLIGLSLLRIVEAQPKTYTTVFSATENPISENGNWVNGHTLGVDWKDVRTMPGLAMGTQSGAVGYDDSTALLTGTWGANQMVQATVHTVNQQSGSVYEEVEIRLRSAISPNRITGYEINFRCSHNGQYYTVVRWNGPINDFTTLMSGGGPGLSDGDVVKATVVGSGISVYINGVLLSTVSDGTYTTGNPGMGFFMQGGSSNLDGDFGFTSFMASEIETPPAAPTNLRVL
jgi:hypothetical protein